MRKVVESPKVSRRGKLIPESEQILNLFRRRSDPVIIDFFVHQPEIKTRGKEGCIVELSSRATGATITVVRRLKVVVHGEGQSQEIHLVSRWSGFNLNFIAHWVISRIQASDLDVEIENPAKLGRIVSSVENYETFKKWFLQFRTGGFEETCQGVAQSSSRSIRDVALHWYLAHADEAWFRKDMDWLLPKKEVLEAMKEMDLSSSEEETHMPVRRRLLRDLPVFQEDTAVPVGTSPVQPPVEPSKGEKVVATVGEEKPEPPKDLVSAWDFLRGRAIRLPEGKGFAVIDPASLLNERFRRDGERMYRELTSLNALSIMTKEEARELGIVLEDDSWAYYLRPLGPLPEEEEETDTE